MSVARLSRQEPPEEPQPLGHEVRTLQRDTDRDHRVGQERVGVVEPRFGPRPRRVVARFEHRVGGVAQERQGRGVRGIDGDDRGGAQGGKGHGARILGPLLRAAFEERARRSGDRELHTGRGRSQSPETSTPAVLGRTFARPRSVGRSSISTVAVWTHRVADERERTLSQRAHRRVRTGFASADHENARDVVDAVTVLTTRRGVLRVLERAEAIRQRDQMVEPWAVGHRVADSGARLSSNSSPSAA